MGLNEGRFRKSFSADAGVAVARNSNLDHWRKFDATGAGERGAFRPGRAECSGGTTCAMLLVQWALLHEMAFMDETMVQKMASDR